MVIRESFHVILYIVILARIVLESLGIIVSNDLLLFSFYIFVYINGQAAILHCRSPPIKTNFWKFVSNGGFFIEDNKLFIKRSKDFRY